MIGISEWFLIFAVLFSNSAVNCKRYKLILTNNGPATTGANVTINATVVDNNGNCPEGLLIFKYEDDTLPRHISKKETKSCEAIFDIPFETTIIKPSMYRYRIDVLKKIMHNTRSSIDIPIVSKLGELNITGHLNGQLQVFQNNINLSKNDPQTIYVSSNSETMYKVELNSADLDYLNTNADSIIIYWFVDNVYQGNTSNYTFSTHFTQSDTQHEILGIVVASIGPSLQSTVLNYPKNVSFLKLQTKTDPLNITTPYPYTTTPYPYTTTPYPSTTTSTTPTTPYPYTTTPYPYTTTPYPSTTTSTTPTTPYPYTTTPYPYTTTSTTPTTPYPYTTTPYPYTTTSTTPYPYTTTPYPYTTTPYPYTITPPTTTTPYPYTTTPYPYTTTPYPYTTTILPPTPPNTNTNSITFTDTQTTTSTKGTTTIITTRTTVTTIITTTITAVADDNSTASIYKEPQRKRLIDSLLSSIIRLETNQKYGYFNHSVFVIG